MRDPCEECIVISCCDSNDSCQRFLIANMDMSMRPKVPEEGSYFWYVTRNEYEQLSQLYNDLTTTSRSIMWDRFEDLIYNVAKRAFETGRRSLKYSREDK